MIESIPYHENTAELFKLFAHQPWAVFLDSCYPSHTTAHFDIIAFQPKVTLKTFQEHSLIVFADGTSEKTYTDPFELLKKYTLNNEIHVADLPFTGGAIGYFSYDLVRTFENLPLLAANKCQIPVMQVGIYTTCIVTDHHEKKSWFITDTHKSFLDYITPLKNNLRFSPFRLIKNFESNFTKESYAAAFATIKHHIYHGDCYQINLTQQFSAPFMGSTWNVYEFMRKVNPAPYAAYLNFPETTIMSFSPEEFICSQGKQVMTRPIKGTRPRHEDPKIDMQNKNALIHSEKDLAENVMIVDLLRNDFGKICEYSSIHVTELAALKTFANVHHLESTIQGQLRKKYNAIDLLKACFPGGSITGTPKIRAMEIIETIEPDRRNIYCGCIGYINYAGDMDLNIAIRTLYTFNNHIYCSAGGAIVADSKIDAEYQECFDKVKILLHHLEESFS